MKESMKKEPMVWNLNEGRTLPRNRLDELADCLNNGGIIFAPTDTTYGILGLGNNQLTLEKIRRIKNRSSKKPFIQLIVDLYQVPREAKKSIPYFYRLAGMYWPGPLTLVLPQRTSDKKIMQGIALRIPAHPFLLDLLPLLQAPLVAPSANREGEKTCRSVEEGVETFGGEVDIYINGGTLDGGKYSTLVTLESDIPKIIREGKIPKNEIEHSITATHIIFICTGNTCRSPLAEALAKKMLPREKFEISSAGIAATDGQRISAYSAELIRGEGQDPEEFRTKRVSDIDILSQDLILALNADHRHYLQSAYPERKDQIRLITEFGNKSPLGIPDPIGGNKDAYKSCYDEIKRCIQGIGERV